VLKAMMYILKWQKHYAKPLVETKKGLVDHHSKVCGHGVPRPNGHQLLLKNLPKLVALSKFLETL